VCGVSIPGEFSTLTNLNEQCAEDHRTVLVSFVDMVLLGGRTLKSDRQSSSLPLRSSGGRGRFQDAGGKWHTVVACNGHRPNCPRSRGLRLPHGRSGAPQPAVLDVEVALSQIRHLCDARSMSPGQPWQPRTIVRRRYG
jgi:hypothetical protein